MWKYEKPKLKIPGAELDYAYLIFFLTGLRICTGEYKTQGPT